ncbi:MAG: bestrophin family protein [Bradymonadia bacterium]
MIDYPKSKWFPLLMSWKGTVLPRILLRVLVLVWIAVGVVWWNKNYYRIDELDQLAHTVLGVPLGLLLVFRTNSAYDRFWEGRKRWGGLVNASRNLVRSATSYAGQADELYPLVAAYVVSLRQHLRREPSIPSLEGMLPDHLMKRLEGQSNPPMIIAQWMSDWVVQEVKSGKLNPDLARALESYIGEMLDHQGACERILKTPVPFAYVAHIRQLLSLYLATLPFVLVHRMDWLTVPAVFLISFGLLGIEDIGVEIEDPFGTDPNDLPLEGLCETIGANVKTLAEQVRVRAA